MGGDFAERVVAVINKGEKVVASHRPNPPNVFGFPTLDTGLFNEWRTQALSLLVHSIGSGHVYSESFRTETAKGAFQSVARAGIGVLKALLEDVRGGNLVGDSAELASGNNPLLILEQICGRFHLVARQLRSRRENRPTLSVMDEYDVQDLLHALLCLHFEDIRPEEWAPSYAGRSSRMDFLLKPEQIVVETKKSRFTLTERELGSELLEDIARYEKHPDCSALFCFVYDPDGFVANPRGVESDLNRAEPFPVRVLIRP